MAKTAKRRHHALRLRSKWLHLLKGMDPNRSIECLKFGRIFSGDPIDCGNPRCPLCSFGKVLKSKEQRIKRRREERDSEVYSEGQ